MSQCDCANYGEDGTAERGRRSTAMNSTCAFQSAAKRHVDYFPALGPDEGNAECIVHTVVGLRLRRKDSGAVGPVCDFQALAARVRTRAFFKTQDRRHLISPCGQSALLCLLLLLP
jgi:hypothetical protein